METTRTDEVEAIKHRATELQRSMATIWGQVKDEVGKASERSMAAMSDASKSEPGSPPTSIWKTIQTVAATTASSAKLYVAPLAAKAGISLPAAEDPSADDEISPSSELISGPRNLATGLKEELSGLCPQLTFTQRLVGASACIGLGLLCTILASIALLSGKAHVTDYAIFYTMGNIISICGSGFVVGPHRQLTLMCQPERRFACALYFCTMIVTLIFAVFYPNALLIFAMVSVQYAALVWYGASFVPFGRTLITKAFFSASNAAKTALDM